jgi:hypothetical protein
MAALHIENLWIQREFFPHLPPLCRSMVLFQNPGSAKIYVGQGVYLPIKRENGVRTIWKS